MVLTIGDGVDDLRTHSGAGEGERNATLCYLVGCHLKRGNSVEAIEPLDLQWAERCRPPYPAQEVRRTVNALARKHDNGREHEQIKSVHVGEEGRKEIIAHGDGEGDSQADAELIPSFPRW